MDDIESCEERERWPEPLNVMVSMMCLKVGLKEKLSIMLSKIIVVRVHEAAPFEHIIHCLTRFVAA